MMMKNAINHSCILFCIIWTVHIANSTTIPKEEVHNDDAIYIARNTSELGAILVRSGVDLEKVVSVVFAHATQGRRQSLSLVFWMCIYIRPDGAAAEELSDLVNRCLDAFSDDFFAEILDEQSMKTKNAIKEYLLPEWGDTEEEQYRNLKQTYPKVAHILESSL